MKNALIFFLFGALTVVVIVHFYQRPAPSKVAVKDSATALAEQAKDAAGAVAAQTRQAAGRMKDTVTAKLEDWHLSPDEIRAELARTGEIVRTRAHAAGETIADARLVAVIKAKYVLDRDLSAFDVAVSADAGHITLTGGVATLELIARAVRLALDTEGVHRVTSKLAVQPRTS